MTTLVVKYLPNHPNSRSEALLQRFLGQLSSSERIEELDLLKTPAPMFNSDSLTAYTMRDMMAAPISEEQKQLLAPFDALIAQALRADTLVMAFPMHNFSFPAAMKAYFDAIMLNNGTWRYGPGDGQYTGLMKGKRALVFAAAGGLYLSPPNPWDHLSGLARVELEFMGFSNIEIVLAEGMMRDEQVRLASLERCYHQIDALIKNWFEHSINT